MTRYFALALLLLGACPSPRAAPEGGASPSGRAERAEQSFVGQVPNEDGCGRMRATCDAARARCERANRDKGPDDPHPLLVPCDLDYAVCLGRCRPGWHTPP